MKINKDNYEAYALDHLEGTLSQEDKEALLAFFDRHPALAKALETDISITLRQEHVSFKDKDLLLRHAAEAYGLPAKDYLLIKKSEEGLTRDEEAELMLAIPRNEERKQKESAYHKARLKAFTNITYKEKQELQRGIFVPFTYRIKQMTAAAVALLILALGTHWWLNSLQTSPGNKPGYAGVKTLEPLKSSNAANVIAGINTKPMVNQLHLSEVQKKADDLPKEESNPYIDKKRSNSTELASLSPIKNLQLTDNNTVNAYEHALSVMMPQYLQNQRLREELAVTYHRINQKDKTPTFTLALLEGGVKVMNFLSPDALEMKKYYNDKGQITAYEVKGSNLHLNTRIR
ncbi:MULTISPECIES: hypothetical protein [unclassified Carboxylicivirga]|uniref:hypothetical protein n=1 Tax=Carboxylicivirga TaxID=1628153 RepID=UPI003D34B6DA